MTKHVFGNFKSVSNAESAANKLKAAGYPAESIVFIANDDSMKRLEQQYAEAAGGKISIWTRLNNIFDPEPDIPDWDTPQLKEYKKKVAKGSILLTIDDSKLPKGFRKSFYTKL